MSPCCFHVCGCDVNIGISKICMLFKVTIKSLWIEVCGNRNVNDQCAKMTIFSYQVYQKIEQIYMPVVYAN